MNTFLRTICVLSGPRQFQALLVAIALSLLIPATATADATPVRRALLVGVGDYPGLPRDKQLQGPPNDVRELRRVLERNWGFSAANIRSLVDAQATRGAIIAELDRLIDAAQSGDVILVYFSGHGTSGRDPSNALVKQDLSDTGAFFPHDADVRSEQRALDSLLIGRRDLRPRLDQLDRTGASIYVVADACFSGSLVRSALTGVPTRQMAIPGGIRIPPRRPAGQVQAQMVTGDDELESPYRNVMFLSAVGTGEPAIDVTASFLSVYPTLSGQPQGAFTDALVRVLAGQVSADFNRDQQISFSELTRATEDQLHRMKIPYQPRTIPGSRTPGYALAQRSAFSSPELPQTAPRKAPVAAAADVISPIRVKLGSGVQEGLAAEFRVAGKDRLELVSARSDLVVSISDGNAYICDSVGDALAVMPDFDADRARDRAELVGGVVARSIYRSIVDRARRQSTFAIKLDLADSNLTAVQECARTEQQQIAGNRASAEVKARCAFDVGARLDQPARLLALNFDPSGRFYRIFPLAAALESGQLTVAAGNSYRLISTYVEGRGHIQGVERVLALALPARGEAIDLGLFESETPAEDAETMLLDLLNRAGSGIAVAELEIPVVPLGARERPGLGVCIDDL